MAAVAKDGHLVKLQHKSCSTIRNPKIIRIYKLVHYQGHEPVEIMGMHDP
jgi:hypothetical protein